jgi:hypothetical protein
MCLAVGFAVVATAETEASARRLELLHVAMTRPAIFCTRWNESAEVILISRQEKLVNLVSVVSINLGIWFFEIETSDASESIEPQESH